MNSEVESSDKLEVNKINENAISSIEFRKHDNYASQEETGNEYEDEDEFHEKKLWHYLRRPLIDDIYDENEEEEAKEHNDFEDFEFSPIKYSTEVLKDGEREEIMAKLKEIQDESIILTIKNKFLHKKYINLIRNLPSASNALDRIDDRLIFEDTRYQRTIENYGYVSSEINEKREFLSGEYEARKTNYAVAETKYKQIFENLMAQEIAVARKIVPQKLSRQEWLEEVTRVLENQRQRIMNVAKIRFAYIRLYSQLENSQLKLQEFDDFGPGFSMIDYEVLSKRKEIYSDKRVEQCESIKKYSNYNLFCTAIIKHFDEELNLFNEKIKSEYDNLNMILNENEMKHCKNIEMVKMRGSILKKIMNLKENIGLLDNIFLIKKMESDLIKIMILKKRADNIKLKMLKDERRTSNIY